MRLLISATSAFERLDVGNEMFDKNKLKKDRTANG
jgi:hypothetical protein